MTEIRNFSNATTSVGDARRFARDALSGYSPELLEVATLMVSELASNCVRHTDSDFEIRVVADGRQVRVEVTDWAAGEPTVREPDPTAISGRGLAIVEMLATSWGIIAAGSSKGKTVWFALDVAAHAPRVEATAMRDSSPSAGPSKPGRLQMRARLSAPTAPLRVRPSASAQRRRPAVAGLPGWAILGSNQ